MGRETKAITSMAYERKMMPHIRAGVAEANEWRKRLQQGSCRLVGRYAQGLSDNMTLA